MRAILAVITGLLWTSYAGAATLQCNLFTGLQAWQGGQKHDVTFSYESGSSHVDVEDSFVSAANGSPVHRILSGQVVQSPARAQFTYSYDTPSGTPVLIYRVTVSRDDLTLNETVDGAGNPLVAWGSSSVVKATPKKF